MTVGLLGQKLGMTRFLSEDGNVVAASVVKVATNRIVQRKKIATDGYNALQITMELKINRKGELKTNRISRAIKGHYAKASEPIGLSLCEFKVSEEMLSIKSLDLSLLTQNQFVNVTAYSKGKGFQGGIKRHNFKSQDATHGNSVSHRSIGSTGQCQSPGRVFKGKKMPGHMGNIKITEENLQILKINKEHNLLLVKGAIPGAKNAFVRIVLAHKKQKENEKAFLNEKKAKAG